MRRIFRSSIYFLLIFSFTSLSAQTGWIQQNTGTTEVLNSIHFPSPSVGYIVGKNGTVLKTIDGGITWNNLNSGISDHLECVFFVNPDTGLVGGWYGAMYRTTDGGASWTSVGPLPNSGGQYSLHFFDELNGLTGGASPLYKTMDGGLTWNVADPNVSAMGMSFVDASTGYAAGGNKVYKTTDGGNTWIQVHSGVPVDYFLGTYFLNANYGFVVGDYSVVKKTIDGGVTWTTTFAGDLNHDIWMMDENNGYMVGTPGAIHKTSDGGASWTVDYANYPTALFTIYSPDPSVAYVVGSSGQLLKNSFGAPAIMLSTGKVVFGSISVGDTAHKSFSVINTGTADLSVSEILSSGLFVPNPDSFTVSPGDSQVVTVEFLPSQIGNFQGNLWLVSNDPINDTLALPVVGNAIGIPSQYAYVLDFFSGNLARFSLSTPSVSTVIGTVQNQLQGADFGVGGVLYALQSSPANNLLQIDTSNAAFTTIGPATPLPGHLWSGLAFDPTTNTLYACSTTGNTESAIYILDTGTGAATAVGTTSTADAIADIAIAESGQMYALDLGDQAIYRVDKTNASVTLLGNTGYPAAGFWHGMDFQAGTGELFLASYNSIPIINELRKVNLSTGGTTVVGQIFYQTGTLAIPGGSGAFAQISVNPASITFDTTGIGNSTVETITIHNTGNAALDVTDIQSTNTAFTVNLTNFTVSPGDSQMVDVTFSPTQLGSYSGDIQISSNDPLNPMVAVPVTGVGSFVVGIPNPSALPQKFSVARNYPNPFNPATTIRFQLPENSPVRLDVFNLLGRKVCTLVERRMEAGYHSVVWDGRNDAGNLVGSGIYIYRFEAGDYTRTRKMVLMK